MRPNVIFGYLQGIPYSGDEAIGNRKRRIGQAPDRSEEAFNCIRTTKISDDGPETDQTRKLQPAPR